MPPDAGSAPALLLVHGAWHGAWCWEDAFAPYLREQGLRVETIDLPGHGQAGRKRLPWLRIADYVDDVEAKLNSMGGPVVIAGHSMGGYTVQKLMERRSPNLAGAILVAAETPKGVWGVVSQLLRRHPIDFLVANLTLSLYHLVRTPERAQALFRSASMPAETSQMHWQRLNNESFRAFVDMLGLNPIRYSKIDAALPKLVLGGEQDVIFPPKAVQTNAAAYGMQAKLYADMPHNLMQDARWQQVADDIARWCLALPR